MNEITKYEYRGSLKYLTREKDKIVIKPKKRYDLEKVYQYLDDHGISLYLKPLEIRKEEVLFPYLPDTLLTKEERAHKLIYALSLWQNKTTIYKKIDMDEVKKNYEEKKKQISHLFSYYQDLQNVVETKVYMSPSEYFFIRNVSQIYLSLSLADRFLSLWYEKMQKEKSTRLVYCHGKCELSHFLPYDSDGFFISLEQAHIGKVSEDFLFFYRKHGKEIDMNSLFHFYQQKYPYSKEEKFYFFMELSIPFLIELYPSSFSKCQELVSFYDGIKLINEFLLEQEQIEKSHQ